MSDQTFPNGTKPEPMTLASVEQRLTDLCVEGDIAVPDAILDNRNGSFTALWFTEKLALVIDDDSEFDAEIIQFPELQPPDLGEAA
jgi:hypothetical protein